MNSLKMTNHAEIRIKQRGIPREIVSIIMGFGIAEGAPGEATKYYLRNQVADELIREKKREIEMIERSKNIYLIISNDDNSVITVSRS